MGSSIIYSIDGLILGFLFSIFNIKFFKSSLILLFDENGSGALSDLSISIKSHMLFAGKGYLNVINSYIITPKDQISTPDL